MKCGCGDRCCCRGCAGGGGGLYVDERGPWWLFVVSAALVGVAVWVVLWCTR